MMRYQGSLRATAVLATLIIAGCSDTKQAPTPTPVSPTPPPVTATVSAYILEGASTRGAEAFSVAPIVVYKGERLRWVNGDSVAHAVVSDIPGFLMTDDLAPRGGEQSAIITKTGTTTIHCRIHPGMVGTLEVRER